MAIGITYAMVEENTNDKVYRHTEQAGSHPQLMLSVRRLAMFSGKIDSKNLLSSDLTWVLSSQKNLLR